MLFRFSLYGFLKNQRYFEPFLLLILLDKGLSYTAIGWLIGFRELVVNLLEIPTGAVADVWGRRMSMILSFVAYIGSFLTFAEARTLLPLYAAMLLFGVGEAFRTGTHKAMIFTWLRLQGREDERTRVYGYTRSWSQIGSAVSVAIAAVFVFFRDDYSEVFYLAVAPCLVNILNVLGYPKKVDGERSSAASFGAILRHTFSSLRDAVRKPGLRRLVLESVGFEGTFDAVKDYLQPVLKAAALAAAAHWVATDRYSPTQQSAFFIGPVYFGVFMMTAMGSRWSHRFEGWAGGEDRAARRLWFVAALAYLALAFAGYVCASAILVGAFVLLHIVQNLWRPILIARFDTHGSEAKGATILSIESQAQRMGTMILAPLLGSAVDAVKGHGPGGEFWPLGVAGAAIAITFGIYGLDRAMRRD